MSVTLEQANILIHEHKMHPVILQKALDAIQADGTYVPLAMGTNDQWEAATMGFQNIGPNYWLGETGRIGLIEGTEKLTDQQYVDTYTTLAKWADYMPDGFEAIAYPDSQALFTLGGAAIYPAGSWDIALFNDQADFALGAFPPPFPTEFMSDLALGYRSRRRFHSTAHECREECVGGSTNEKPQQPRIVINEQDLDFGLGGRVGHAGRVDRFS